MVTVFVVSILHSPFPVYVYWADMPKGVSRSTDEALRTPLWLIVAKGEFSLHVVSLVTTRVEPSLNDAVAV